MNIEVTFKAESMKDLLNQVQAYYLELCESRNLTYQLEQIRNEKNTLTQFAMKEKK